MARHIQLSSEVGFVNSSSSSSDGLLFVIPISLVVADVRLMRFLSAKADVYR